jgi:S-formylglutathione hydrolase FrmB
MMPFAFKKNRLVFLVFVAAAFSAVALLAQFNEDRRRSDLGPFTLPGGSIVEFKSFESQSLGGPSHFSIFLPPSYSKNSSLSYPVIYFLHGLNNDETSWTVERYGNIQNIVEQMMVDKKIPESIMVHPRGDRSFYCNFIDGSKKYEDLIANELIAYIEKNYRAKKDRNNRAIAGTSMGGYGALKIAIKFPERYVAVAAQSPIIFPGTNPAEFLETMKSNRFYSFFAGMMTPIFGNPIQQDLWDANNPLVLAKSGKLQNLSIYFDYGTNDQYIPMTHLDEGCKAFDDVLTKAKVPHVFKIRQGEPHGWALVASHLAETLPFLSQTFK